MLLTYFLVAVIIIVVSIFVWMTAQTRRSHFEMILLYFHPQLVSVSSRTKPWLKLRKQRERKLKKSTQLQAAIYHNPPAAFTCTNEAANKEADWEKWTGNCLLALKRSNFYGNSRASCLLKLEKHHHLMCHLHPLHLGNVQGIRWEVSLESLRKRIEGELRSFCTPPCIIINNYEQFVLFEPKLLFHSALCPRAAMRARVGMVGCLFVVELYGLEVEDRKEEAEGGRWGGKFGKFGGKIRSVVPRIVQLFRIYFVMQIKNNST